MLAIKGSSVAVLASWICLSLTTTNTTAAELPSQMQAGEHRLVLNGMGSRSKAFIELYQAGLYLTQPSSNPQSIIAANAPMAIRIKITSSFVSQSKLVDSLNEGFNKATGGNTRAVEAEIKQFRQCFADDITRGDVYDLVYIPQYGVIVNKNGKLKGAIRGLEFKRALFSIWLSNDPADKGLRQAMLTSGPNR